MSAETNGAMPAHDFTKREAFAMAAMQGFIATGEYSASTDQQIAGCSVKVADALLEELAKGDSNGR